MEEKTFISLYQRPFAEQIVFNLEQLNYRYKRLSQIDTTNRRIKMNILCYLIHSLLYSELYS